VKATVDVVRRRGLPVGFLVCGLLASAAGAWGCRDKTSSEYVADEFADAYFRRMDQDAALKFTALGATEMLDKELADTKALRESGYTPAEAAASVSFTHGPPVRREARVGFHYAITIRADNSDPVKREADLELARVDGAWKVVSVRLAK
jgi:hypothetical protein